jgi:glutamate carboxypeptidase
VSDYLTFIDDKFEEMCDRLESFANINTHTYNLVGLDSAIYELEKMFKELEPDEHDQIQLGEVETVNSDGTVGKLLHGRVLRLYKRRDAKKKILLCGHYDTVYPKEHDFQKVTREGNKMMGPGVLDMKGGLITMLYALLAYENSDIKNKFGWEVLIVSDEEVGSIASYPYLKQAAENNDFGLLYEPAFPDGRIVKQRKGVGSYTMTFRGVSAHAGRCFHDGVNAFWGVAELIEWSKKIMDTNKDVTINIGKIEGGGPTNVVPDLGICRFNCRVVNKTQQKMLERELRKFVKEMQKKYPGSELHGRFTSPPKPYTKEAKKIGAGILKCAKELGIKNIGLVATGGASDGNKLNGYGLPNMDSLGPVGDGMHSRDEMIFIDSLNERTKMSALYLKKITEE